jgi:hypothetical protein
MIAIAGVDGGRDPSDNRSRDAVSSLFSTERTVQRKDEKATLVPSLGKKIEIAVSVALDFEILSFEIFVVVQVLSFHIGPNIDVGDYSGPTFSHSDYPYKTNLITPSKLHSITPSKLKICCEIA